MKHLALCTSILLAAFMAVELPPQMPELMGKPIVVNNRQNRRKKQRLN